MNDKDKDCGEWVENITERDGCAHVDDLIALGVTDSRIIDKCVWRFLKTFGESE